MAKSEIKQLHNTYQSTISFYNFLKKNNVLTNPQLNLLDAGCGIGANILYYSKKLPKAKFVGIDYLKERIKYAKKINKNPNVEFLVDDILKNRNKINKNIDVVTCVHTLCCFKKIDIPLRYMFRLKPNWIAINSLFYDGPLDVLIHIRDHESNIKDDNVNSDFNIFSLSNLRNILKKSKYKIYKSQPFFPYKKIAKPAKGKRGSYTMKTEINQKTTFSGPVHLPWYFVLLKKKEIRLKK